MKVIDRKSPMYVIRKEMTLQSTYVLKHVIKIYKTYTVTYRCLQLNLLFAVDYEI